MKFTDGCWLSKPGVTLHVRTEPVSPAGVTVEFLLEDVMNGVQRVEVARRDALFETQTVRQGQTSLLIDVPDACYQNGEIILELRFPDAMSDYQKNGFKNHDDTYYRKAIAIQGIIFHEQSN